MWHVKRNNNRSSLNIRSSLLVQYIILPTFSPRFHNHFAIWQHGKDAFGYSLDAVYLTAVIIIDDRCYVNHLPCDSAYNWWPVLCKTSEILMSFLINTWKNVILTKFYIDCSATVLYVDCAVLMVPEIWCQVSHQLAPYVTDPFVIVGLMFACHTPNSPRTTMVAAMPTASLSRWPRGNIHLPGACFNNRDQLNQHRHCSRAEKRNYINVKRGGGAIIPPCSNFNGGLAEPPLKLAWMNNTIPYKNMGAFTFPLPCPKFN